jgi:hypothetical protein
MPNLFRRKTLFIAGISGCLLLLLLLFFVLWPAQVSGTLELRISDAPLLSNGVLVVNVVLSNGTAHSLNIVDDTAGKPLFILDAGSDYYPAGSLGHGSWLGPIGNTLKLNLAPGASLTSSVGVSNPPPRFRLRATTRDLAEEHRGFLARLAADALPRSWSEKLPGRPGNSMSTDMLPTSDWIEFKMPEH